MVGANEPPVRLDYLRNRSCEMPWKKNAAKSGALLIVIINVNSFARCRKLRGSWLARLEFNV